jgi:hypothetical protein
MSEENSKNKQQDTTEIHTSNTIKYALIDNLIWILFVVIATGKLWFELIFGSPKIPAHNVALIIADNYLSIATGIIIILTPIIFKQIFGQRPLEFLRYRREILYKTRYPDAINIKGEGNITVNMPPITESGQILNLSLDNPLEFLKVLAISSNKISEKIYTRSEFSLRHSIDQKIRILLCNFTHMATYFST